VAKAVAVAQGQVRAAPAWAARAPLAQRAPQFRGNQPRAGSARSAPARHQGYQRRRRFAWRRTVLRTPPSQRSHRSGDLNRTLQQRARRRFRASDGCSSTASARGRDPCGAVDPSVAPLKFPGKATWSWPHGACQAWAACSAPRKLGERPRHLRSRGTVGEGPLRQRPPPPPPPRGQGCRAAALRAIGEGHNSLAACSTSGSCRGPALRPDNPEQRDCFRSVAGGGWARPVQRQDSGTRPARAIENKKGPKHRDQQGGR